MGKTLRSIYFIRNVKYNSENNILSIYDMKHKIKLKFNNNSSILYFEDNTRQGTLTPEELFDKISIVMLECNSIFKLTDVEHENGVVKTCKFEVINFEKEN